MWTRRKFLGRGGLAFLIGSFTNLSIFWNFISTSWAKAKQLLPKGFPKDQMINMNPAEIDNHNLDIDPLDKFETMGPTDVAIDLKTYRLKITGEVGRPLSLSYEQILQYPSQLMLSFSSVPVSLPTMDAGQGSISRSCLRKHRSEKKLTTSISRGHTKRWSGFR